MASRAEQHRLRVRYGKDGRLAYLGHLEVLATINRSVRRSGLPFAVGNGFARRIRLQFSQALPVGASSRGEYFDLLLTDRVGEGEALTALRAATPAGLAPQALCYVPHRLPALEAWLSDSLWRVELLGEAVPAQLGDAIVELRSRGSLEYLRGERRKVVDLGSALRDWDVDAGGRELAIVTHATNEASLRPAVLLDAAFRLMGLRPPSLRASREAQWHVGDDGSKLDALGPWE